MSLNGSYGLYIFILDILIKNDIMFMTSNVKIRYSYT